MAKVRRVEEDPYQPPEPVQPPPLPTDEVKPWGAGWALLWGFLVFVFWSGAQGVVGGFYVVIGHGGKPEDLSAAMEALPKDGDAVGVMTFVGALVGCALILAIVKLKGTTFARGLGLRWPVWWAWPVSIVATFVGLIVIGLALSPFRQSEEVEPFMLEMIQGTDFLVLLFLGVVVGAPLFEEFFFRGLLHEGLKQSFLGRWGAILLTAGFFAVIHLQYEDPTAFVMLFFLGLMFGWARELTGSLWIPIAMHAFNNLFATVRVYAVSEGWVPETAVWVWWFGLG
ncbi:MAG: type II CAAX endopeptidase family protein [Verrucomicrobiota bacterium]